MTKNKKAASDYKHITPALVKDVRTVIAEADGHSLSVSRIYAASNSVFQTKDAPQNCPSCLRQRVKNLREWLKEYDAAKGTKVAPPVDTAATPDTAPPVDAEVFTDEEEGALKEMLGITADTSDADYSAALSEYLTNTPDLDPTDIAKVNAKLAALVPVVDTDAPLTVVKLDKDGAQIAGSTASVVFAPTADNVNKGKLTVAATGKGVAPGKYVTTETPPRNLSVQIGGNATFKVEDLT